MNVHRRVASVGKGGCKGRIARIGAKGGGGSALEQHVLHRLCVAVGAAALGAGGGRSGMPADAAGQVGEGAAHVHRGLGMGEGGVVRRVPGIPWHVLGEALFLGQLAALEAVVSGVVGVHGAPTGGSGRR